MSQIKSRHTFGDDVLQDFDAVEIATLLKSGEISAQQVTEAAIERVAKINPDINAVQAECYQQARDNARDTHKKGALLENSQAVFFAGVPTFIKDNTDIVGVPTNHGSAALNSQAKKEYDPYIKQYLSQGFNVLGKSSLSEFGFNATCEPTHDAPTRNPWNLEHSTGASSAGSAALVAAGVIPIAHANDGGGSIRIPAACCGLVGLKPSRGRHIYNHQAAQLPIKIVSDGVVTRSVRDTARFHYEAEKFYQNKKLPEIGLVEGPSNRKLRIGYIVDSITGTKTDAVTTKTLMDTVKLLEGMGHEVFPTEIPVKQSFIEDFSLYWSLLAFATEKSGKRVMDKSFQADKIDGLSKGLSKMFAKNFYKAPGFFYRLHKTYKEYAQFFQRNRLDLMLSPVLAQETFALGHISPDVEFDQLFQRLMGYVSFTPVANASGAPSLSLPLAMSDNNLPVSMMFSANHGDEKTLLEIAYAIEAEQPWPMIHQRQQKEQQASTQPAATSLSPAS